MNEQQEVKAVAMTKEFEEDIVAIEQDGDNDDTAKDLLKRERREAFFKSMMELQQSYAPVVVPPAAASSASIVVREQTKYKLESCASNHIHNYADRALDSVTASDGILHWSRDQIRMQTTNSQRLEIGNAFASYISSDGEVIADADKWMEWGDNTKLSALLKEVFPKTSAPTDQQRMQTLNFDINCLTTPRHMGKFVAEAQLLIDWETRAEEFNAMSTTAFQTLADIFIDKVIGKRQQSCKVTAELIARIKAKAPTSMGELFIVATRIGKDFYELSQSLMRMGIPFLVAKEPYHPKRPYEGKQEDKDSKKPKGEGANEDEKIHCTNCQKFHKGGAAQCTFKQGGGGGGRYGSSSSSSSQYKSGANASRAKTYLTPSGKGGGKSKSTDTYHIDDLLIIECSLNKLSEDKFACEYPMQITTMNNEVINVNALIDTGANSSNYLSLQLFDRIKQGGNTPHHVSGTVKGGLTTNKHVDVQHAISFSLSYNVEILCDDVNNKQCSNKIHKQFATAKLLPIDYDLIIGLPSIRKWQLIKSIPSIFIEEKKIPKVVSAGPCVLIGDVLTHLSATPAGTLFSTTESEEVRMASPFLPSSTTWEDTDVSTRYEKSVIPGIDIEETPADGGNNPLEGINFEGPPTLQKKARKLCYEFRDIISDSLGNKPAKVNAPMSIDIDEGRWFNEPGNRRPSRAQSAAKEHEIRRQVDKMIANNIIRPSDARAWSQVLLVRKPDLRWRFCVDFRNINAITRLTSGHPIPNIKEMLHRLGSHNARYYATLDLTSGYFQTPLAQQAMAFTAFITSFGLFEFTRVPMGIKGAAPFFQQFIAVTVLAGLIYSICENYIDDVIVHGQTEDEFLDNLRKVFTRFRKYNIKLQPSKMNIGLTKVQYVGHTIDKDGIHFSPSKLDSILSFQKPVYHAQLRSFLGLANYFRDHVKHHSTLVYPLQRLLDTYDRRAKLNWTPETDAAWENIKHAIHDCPKLFFLDNISAIHLYTDASDYGIGAYLCQIVDGKEVPIAFISKTLTQSQREKWSVPQKEAYAIYYALCKLEYLLLDRPFTIHTDHKNLTYINDSVNAMVVRWKLYLQEYTFDIQFIKGLDNIVADNFSRLCILSEDNHETEEEMLQFIEQDERFFSLLELKRVPKEAREIIKKVHNSSVGHHGVERTIRKIEESGATWKDMRQHVRTFIAKCPCCQLMSHLAPMIRSTPFTLSHSKPMHTLAVDTIGPLPEDERGNKYIIAIIDEFSRFLEIFAAPDATAAPAADALFQHAGRYGTPTTLISDGGSQFVNSVISEFLELMGTDHHITLAYSKQENGIVERSNKEILRHLKAIIYERDILTKWSRYLPMVQRIINSTISTSLGVSPSQIIYGDALNLNRGFIVSIEDKEKYDSEVALSEYSKEMIDRQAKIIAAAQKHQTHANDNYIASKNEKYKHIELTEFPVNSYVLLGYPPTNLKKGPPNKLMMNWQGPYKVISYLGNNYTILDLATMKEDTVNVKRLKQFNYDEDVNPRQVANQATDRYDVEAIISHTGNANYRQKMRFLVKWVGWDVPTEEKWTKELSHLELMHDYLRANKLSQMIPNAFKIHTTKISKKTTKKTKQN
jgi:hypothetical protein